MVQVLLTGRICEVLGRKALYYVSTEYYLTVLFFGGEIVFKPSNTLPAVLFFAFQGKRRIVQSFRLGQHIRPSKIVMTRFPL